METTVAENIRQFTSLLQNKSGNKDREESKMSELKPCPFCGGEVVYSRYSVSGEGRIKCPTCLTTLVFLNMDKSKEEVTQYWNRRKNEDELDAIKIAVGNCGITGIDKPFTSPADAVEQMSYHIPRLNKRLAIMEQQIVEQKTEILNLNQIRFNLYSALSTYMDEEDQLEDEIESTDRQVLDALINEEMVALLNSLAHFADTWNHPIMARQSRTIATKIEKVIEKRR